MSKQTTITGTVAKAVKSGTTKQGQSYVTFQLVADEKRWSVNLAPTVLTVNAFRKLAMGAAAALQPGDRVVVTGTKREMPLPRSSSGSKMTVLTAERIEHR